jgi:hypothetical protein
MDGREEKRRAETNLPTHAYIHMGIHTTHEPFLYVLSCLSYAPFLRDGPLYRRERVHVPAPQWAVILDPIHPLAAQTRPEAVGAHTTALHSTHRGKSTQHKNEGLRNQLRTKQLWKKATVEERKVLSRYKNPIHCLL